MVCRRGYDVPVQSHRAMTFRGHVKHGYAVPDAPASLPHGTPLRIRLERIDSQTAATIPA